MNETLNIGQHLLVRCYSDGYRLAWAVITFAPSLRVLARPFGFLAARSFKFRPTSKQTIIPQMTTPSVKNAIFVAACFCLCAGCDTPQGADALARLLPRVSVRGPGFSGTFRVPSDALKSSKLKFQEAVLRNDISKATRYLNPRYVDAPVKGYPPIFYAAARGQSAMVRVLVRNGASAQRRFSGRSLAYVAASFGHSETAEQLIGMGGGTKADVSYGKSVYAANSRAQRQRVQAGTQLALVFLAAMISGSSDSGSLRSSWDPFGGMSERQYMNAQKGYLSLSEIGPF